MRFPFLNPAVRGRIAIALQCAALVVAAGVVWFGTVAPRLHHHQPQVIFWQALGLTALMWSWSALIGFLVLLMTRLEAPDRASVSSWLQAVWFAPATILASQMTPATVAPALVFTITATRLLFLGWRAKYRARPRPQLFVSALGIAAVSQLCVAALLADSSLAASALLVLATALLTVYALETGAASAGSPAGLPRSAFGAALTLLLAFGLTIGGSWGWVAGSGYGGSDAAPGPRRPASPPAGETAAVPTLPAGALGGDFPGVILLSEVQPVARLVEPRLYTAPGLLAPVDRRPFSIVFDGQYDIFRWPFSRPPANSYTRRGSPTELSFHTSDHWPLQMEARQRLDLPLDVRCCNRIRIQIWNADTSPGRIWLELVLLDHGEAVSLGRVPVLSHPKVGERVGELLEFRLAGDLPLEQADELKLIFSRTMARMERTVKIAIDRFMFEPR